MCDFGWKNFNFHFSFLLKKLNKWEEKLTERRERQREGGWKGEKKEKNKTEKATQQRLVVMRKNRGEKMNESDVAITMKYVESKFE